MKIKKHLTTLCLALICVLAMGMCSVNVYAQDEEVSDDPEAGKTMEVEMMEAPEEEICTDADILSTSPSVTHASKYASLNRKKGVIVSENNGSIDWTKVAADDIDFALIRTDYRGYVYGNVVPDYRGESNLKNAAAAGLEVGAYIYSQATTATEAKVEADCVMTHANEAGLNKKTTKIVMDLEYAYEGGSATGRLYNANLSKTDLTSICQAFCEEVIGEGYTPVILSNYNMLTYKLNADDITNKYDVGLIHLTTQTSYPGEYRYWNYTMSGEVSGIGNHVSMAYEYDLDNTSKSSQKTDTDNTKTEDTTITTKNTTPAICIGTSVNVRSGAGTSYSRIAVLQKYDEIYIRSTTGNWCEIVLDVNGTYKVGYIYSSYVTEKTNYPYTPTLSCAAVSKTKVKLTWNAKTSVDGYLLYRYDKTNKKYVRIAKITSSSVCAYKDSGLAAGTTYKYRIKAYKKVKGVTLCGTSCKTLSATTKKSSYKTGTVNYGTGVNVRTGPSTSYTIITRLKYNTKVTIIGESGYWYKVKFTLNGVSRTGYINKPYLTL